MPELTTPALGRISGKLLSANLLRNGYDLRFKGTTDPNEVLLYLDVNNMKVGINTEPSFDLHVDGSSNSINYIVDNQITIGNNDIIIDSGGNIRSLTGSIIFSPNQSLSPSIELGKSLTDNIEINDNYIRVTSLDTNLLITTDALNEIYIQNSTNIDGDLSVSGSFNITGDLTKQGNLIIGDDIIDNEGNDPETDTLNFAAPLVQDLKPGIDNAFDLGTDQADSANGRWANVFITDNLINVPSITLSSVTISDQLVIDGLSPKIYTLQSNDDLEFLPSTGTSIIEDLSFNANTITNLLSTNLTVYSTDTGYVKFSGNTALVVPSGTNAERVGTEVGETRWNTEEGYLECFDGTTWNLSTGAGEVDEPYMRELGNIYALILG